MYKKIVFILSLFLAFSQSNVFALDAKKSGEVLLKFHTFMIEQAKRYEISIDLFPSTRPEKLVMIPVMPKGEGKDKVELSEKEKANLEMQQKIEKYMPDIMAAVVKELPEIESILNEFFDIIASELPEALKSDPKTQEEKKLFELASDQYVLEILNRAKNFQQKIKKAKKIKPEDALELQKLVILKGLVNSARFPKETDFEADHQISLAQYEAGILYRSKH